MPAIITHHLFGCDVCARDSTLVADGTERDAFLLGCQGPDPLFYAFAATTTPELRRLGTILHTEKTAELLFALKNATELLAPDERSIGRAYALGFICHHALDSTVHPWVFHCQQALCDAGVDGLTRENGTEVHTLIEADLDEMVLYVKRGETIASFAAWRTALPLTERALEVSSFVHAYLDMNVYGLSVSPLLFARSVRAYQQAQRMLHAPSPLKRRVLAGLERLVRPYSLYDAMSPRARAHAESDFDNREHHAWIDPFTGRTRTEGFWDLYDRALDLAGERLAMYDQAEFDLDAARRMTGGRDFHGRPLDAFILAVDED